MSFKIFDSVLICAMRGIIETCPPVSLLPLSYALILVFAIPGSLILPLAPSQKFSALYVSTCPLAAPDTNQG